jgi:hypothetical protein
VAGLQRCATVDVQLATVQVQLATVATRQPFEPSRCLAASRVDVPEQKRTGHSRHKAAVQPLRLATIPEHHTSPQPSRHVTRCLAQLWQRADSKPPSPTHIPRGIHIHMHVHAAAHQRHPAHELHGQLPLVLPQWGWPQVLRQVAAQRAVAYLMVVQALQPHTGHSLLCAAKDRQLQQSLSGA